jgi:N-acetyltransferase
MKSHLQPTLVGEGITLRPLRLEDWDALAAAASDSEIWSQHPEPHRYQPDVFRKFFESGISSGGALVIKESSTGRIIGSSRYYNYSPESSAVSVGYTFLVRDHWGRETNRELKRLMLTHAFQFVDTVIFEVGECNLRSRRALEKLGATLTDERVTSARLDGVPIVHLTYRLARAECPWPVERVVV